MIDERFARTERLIGSSKLQRLHQAFVTVVGLGAVGSYAVEGLARAGVGRFRLVDFDVVRRTNINRQLHAMESTLGRSKVELAQQRVEDINPHCRVEALQLFAHTDTLDAILAGRPDLVIDAIDSLSPKVELLTAVWRRGVPVISAMGAAQRTNPTCIHSGLMSEITCCPLARRIRPFLTRRNVPLNFLCVYSVEPTNAREAGETNPKTIEEEYLERGRRRPLLGSLPTITGIFGLTMAHRALEKLTAEQIKTNEVQNPGSHLRIN